MKYGDSGYVVPWAIEMIDGMWYINVNHIAAKNPSECFTLKIVVLEHIHYDENGVTIIHEVTKKHQYHKEVYPIMEDGIQIKDMKVGQTGWVVPWAICFATNMDQYYIDPRQTINPKPIGTTTVKILRLANHVVFIGECEDIPKRLRSVHDGWIPAIASKHGLLSSLESEFKERDEPKRNKWLITLKDKSQVTIFADNFQFYQGDAYFRNKTDNKYITDLVGYYHDVQSVVLQ